MPKQRYNPETQREEDYLTLKESFRDRAGRVYTHTLLTVGFLPPEVRPEEVRDNTIPFGRTAEQIVREAVAPYSYPVAFGAPFGHLGDSNLALRLGMPARLVVDGQRSSLTINS